MELDLLMRFSVESVRPLIKADSPIKMNLKENHTFGSPFFLP